MSGYLKKVVAFHTTFFATFIFQYTILDTCQLWKCDVSVSIHGRLVVNPFSDDSLYGFKRCGQLRIPGDKTDDFRIKKHLLPHCIVH